MSRWWSSAIAVLALAAAGAWAQGTEAFDVEAATRAYLDTLSPEEKERSDLYFEGGYWLQLWSLLWALGVAWLLLGAGRSARLRDRLEGLARFL